MTRKAMFERSKKNILLRSQVTRRINGIQPARNSEQDSTSGTGCTGAYPVQARRISDTGRGARRGGNPPGARRVILNQHQNHARARGVGVAEKVRGGSVGGYPCIPHSDSPLPHMPVESGIKRRVMGSRRPPAGKEGRPILKPRIGKSRKEPSRL